MSIFTRIADHASRLDAMDVVLFGLVLALAVEAFTIWVRFGLGLQSTRDTGFIGRITFGVRIHHGYFGLVLAPAALLLLSDDPGTRNVLLTIAISLVVSDLVHHFLVLWPVTGSPEFDLVYPRRPTTPEAPRTADDAE